MSPTDGKALRLRVDDVYPRGEEKDGLYERTTDHITAMR